MTTFNYDEIIGSKKERDPDFDLKIAEFNESNYNYLVKLPNEAIASRMLKDITENTNKKISIELKGKSVELTFISFGKRIVHFCDFTNKEGAIEFDITGIIKQLEA